MNEEKRRHVGEAEMRRNESRNAGWFMSYGSAELCDLNQMCGLKNSKDKSKVLQL